VKISSPVFSSSAHPVGLTVRSAANYLPLFGIGAKVGRKTQNNKKNAVSNNTHIIRQLFVFRH